jgi:excisionase family DNA binding protein
MSASVRPYNQPLVPTPELVDAARHLLHQLPKDHPRYALIDRVTGKTLDMDLPIEIFQIIQDVLTAIARNQAVNLLPTNLELTTNQAADVLNVSRGFVLRLIERKELRHHMVGTHRRLRLEDVLAYREKMLADSTSALNELAEIDRGLGLAD